MIRIPNLQETKRGFYVGQRIIYTGDGPKQYSRGIIVDLLGPNTMQLVIQLENTNLQIRASTLTIEPRE